MQAAAHTLGVPFTGHPMIGHDIIYEHPLASGSAIGRTAMRDFLCYAEGVSRLAGGVYLSVGSAVMSPMIFEKSLNMARNIARQRGESIDDHFMLVADLAPSSWDWARGGEPPVNDPAYYLRYCKTFARMGGTMRYLSADNRDLLLGLRRRLRWTSPDDPRPAGSARVRPSLRARPGRFPRRSILDRIERYSTSLSERGAHSWPGRW